MVFPSSGIRGRFWPKFGVRLLASPLLEAASRGPPGRSVAYAMSALMQLDDAPLDRSLEIALAPHSGNVFVDTLPDGLQVITHTVSQERQPLAREYVWDIVYGDDGFAALVGQNVSDPTAEERIDLVENMLNFSVYQSGQEFYIAAHADSRQLVHLSVFSQKFVGASLDIQCGSTSARHKFDASIFKRPRNGAKLFLSLKSVYEQLSFTIFSRQPWRWAWTGAKRWVPWLEKLGLSGHFAFSNQAADASM